MKVYLFFTQCIVISLLFLGTVSSQAKIWTSSDGLKTFEADFISYNPTTNMVTLMRNYHQIKFKANKLSLGNQKWLKAQSEKDLNAEKSQTLTTHVKGPNIVGKKLKWKVLYILSRHRLKPYKLKPPYPDYYLLCFEASW